MASTTDFEQWLGNLDDNDIESMYFLYQSVMFVSDMGGFKSSKKNGITIVESSDNDEKLILSTEKAVKTFLNKLDYDFRGDFGSIDGHYSFVYSMGKDD